MGVNPYCSNCGHITKQHHSDGPCGAKDCTCPAFNSPKTLEKVEQLPTAEKAPKADAKWFDKVDSNESNLVAHARRELAILNAKVKPGDEYTPEEIEGFIKIVQAFADMGHSGGSAPYAIGMINDLLRFRPLTQLTANPDEWEFHGEEKWGEKGGIWQNKRNGEAFSHDGGRSYYLLSEIEKGTVANGRDRIMHHSMGVNLDPDPKPDVNAAPYDR